MEVCYIRPSRGRCDLPGGRVDEDDVRLDDLALVVELREVDGPVVDGRQPLRQVADLIPRVLEIDLFLGDRDGLVLADLVLLARAALRDEEGKEEERDEDRDPDEGPVAEVATRLRRRLMPVRTCIGGRHGTPAGRGSR